jgi:hypothetical protein
MMRVPPITFRACTADYRLVTSSSSSSFYRVVNFMLSHSFSSRRLLHRDAPRDLHSSSVRLPGRLFVPAPRVAAELIFYISLHIVVLAIYIFEAGSSSGGDAALTPTSENVKHKKYRITYRR